MQKLRITIARDGTQKIEVIDGRDDECLALTREFERRLGTPEGERVRKTDEVSESVETHLRESDPDR